MLHSCLILLSVLLERFFFWPSCVERGLARLGWGVGGWLCSGGIHSRLCSCLNFYCFSNCRYKPLIKFCFVPRVINQKGVFSISKYLQIGVSTCFFHSVNCMILIPICVDSVTVLYLELCLETCSLLGCRLITVFEVSDWMGDRLRICFEYWTGQLRA